VAYVEQRKQLLAPHVWCRYALVLIMQGTQQTQVTRPAATSASLASAHLQDYPDVLKELLARSVDDKASIRLVVLGALPDLIGAAPDGKVEGAVVEAGAARVLDPEEKVGAGGRAGGWGIACY
jgi:hypothetical protein